MQLEDKESVAMELQEARDLAAKQRALGEGVRAAVAHVASRGDDSGGVRSQ